MKTLKRSAFALLFVMIGMANTAFIEKEKPAKIEWLTFEEAVELNKTQPKKFFIDVYTDWCGWCKVMDKNTFSDPYIAQYISENYHAVKFNAEQRESVEFQGNTFKFVAQGRKGYHELAAALLNGKLSFPTVVFLDEQMRMIQPIPGYQKPENLAPILTYFAEDHHTKTSWDDFQKNYQSPFENR